MEKRKTGILGVAIALSAALATLATPGGSAQAYDRSFSISDTSLELTPPAVRQGVLVLLPNTGLPAFGLTFVLPVDYRRNSTVRLSLLMATSGNGACRVHFTPIVLIRRRQGVNDVFRAPPGAGSGLTVTNGSETQQLIPGTDSAKFYTIGRAASGAFSEMLAGDVVSIGFVRRSALAEDTCTGSLVIYGGEVSYRVAPQ
jgi:hypothetical protein